MMRGGYEAIVIGGGHNGLAAGAYLARDGLRTVGLEARHKVGGAAATDTPWEEAPEFSVTTYSYVMSLMPRRVIDELRLEHHGYKVYPMGPSYYAFPDGRSLTMTGVDAKKDYEALARFSRKDAQAYGEWRKWLWGRGGGLERFVVAATPGTAYVLMHHEIGDAGLGLSSWGYPRGGMGAVSDALRSSAEEFGAEVRTNAPVERILQRNGRVRGVVLEGGEELEADVVVAATHPRITFLEQLRREDLPDDFVGNIERWNSHSGVVKINLALSELPDFTADPGPGDHLGGAIELAHSIDYIEEAFQDARRGEPARRPFSDGVIPTVFDRTLCPEGYHVMSLFTQWVPHEWSEEPHRDELEAYADRVIDGYSELAPNLKSAILHRQVLGPYDMEQDIGLDRRRERLKERLILRNRG